MNRADRPSQIGVRAATWLLLLLSVFHLPSSISAAVLTGSFKNPDGTGSTNVVRFTPRSTPVADDDDLVVTRDVLATPDADGAFSVTLRAGQYNVSPVTTRPFVVDVPDNTNTYTLNSRITTTLSFASGIPSTNSVPLASDVTSGKVKTATYSADPTVYLTGTVDTLLAAKASLVQLTTTSNALAGLSTVAAVETAFADDIQALVTDPSPSSAKLAYVLGDASGAPGSKGTYRYDPDSMEADDGVNVWICQDKSPSDPGRWIRLTAGDNYQMSVDTIDDALALPKSYLSAALNPTNAVKLTLKPRGRKTVGDGGGVGGYYYVEGQTVRTNRGTRFNYGTGQLVWDGSGVLNIAMFGVRGGVNEEQNLITGNDATFGSYTVDPSWSGYGDASEVLSSTGGTNWTYGIFTIPASGSSLGTFPDIAGYARCNGVASVPPGGTVIFRMTRRGHGYTSGSVQTLTLSGDGGGVANNTVQISTNGFADGYVSGGRFYLKAQSSTTAQTVRIGYKAPTETPIGGLLRALVSGRTYRVTLNAKYESGGAGNRLWFAGTSTNASGRVSFTPTGTDASYTGTFVADGPLFHIGLLTGASSGELYSLDNISLSEVGPDGSASARPDDEGDLIQEALDAVPNSTIVFGPNRRYYSTRGFKLALGQRVDLQGSWIEFDVGSRGDDAFILYGEHPELHDGRISFTGTTPATSGESTQNIISLGHFQYWNYPRVSNARVYNLQLEGYGRGNFPMGIAVNGSRSSAIYNIYFPDNDGLRQCIGVYWSGEQVQHVGVERPVGLFLDNIRSGRLTGTVGTTTNRTAFITVASAASVHARNLFCEYTADGFIRVTPGDIGWQIPKPDSPNMDQSGVTIENAVCADAGRVGFRVQTLLNYVADNAPVIQTNAAVTFDTETEEVILANHGLTDGALVVFSGSAAPSGITLGTRYYATWCSRDRFMLRAASSGSGNGSVIDLGTGSSSVTVTAWRGQVYQRSPVTIRNSFAHSTASATSVAGIYADGADGVKYENVTVTGFRYGFLTDNTVANSNLHLDRCQFVQSGVVGALVGSGNNITFEDCVFAENGQDHAGVAGSSEGIQIDNGQDIRVIRGVFGKASGETTQGAPIGVDNGNYPLRGVVIEDCVFRSGTPVYAIRLDDPASATWNASTFARVAGNRWTSGSGITRLVSSTTATLPLVKQDGALISYNSGGNLAIGKTDPVSNLEVVFGGTNYFSRPFPSLTTAQISAATSASGGFWWDSDLTRLRFFNGTNAYTVATQVPYANNTYDHGTAAVRWKTYFAYDFNAYNDVFVGYNGAAGTADLRFGTNGPRVGWSGTNRIVLRDNLTTGNVELWFGGTSTNAPAFKQDTTNLNLVTLGQLQVNAAPVLSYSGTPSTGYGAVYTNGAWTVLPLGSSGISGSTGSTDNRILRSDGTGGATLQNSVVSLGDETVYSSQYQVQVAATGAQSNNHLVLSPKGSGAFVLGPAPDGSTTGGNNRGTYAVDLQLWRNFAGAVASGDRAVALGARNTAGATYSVTVGYNNWSSAQGAVAMGENTTAAGVASFTAGLNATADGAYAVSHGFYTTAPNRGQFSLSGGNGGVAGGSQSSILTAYRTTTATTQVTLATDGSSGTLALPNNSAWTFDAKVTGITSAAATVYSYTLTGIIVRGANAAATSMPAAVTKVVLYESNAAADCDAVADTSGGALAIKVTPYDSTSTNWSTTVVLNQVIY